jgi:hypothetical protein
LAARNHDKTGGRYRDHRNRSNHYNNGHNRWFKCIFAVNLCLHFGLTAPATAQEGDVYSTAQPQAAATSNNTNQSVQINQSGSSSRQQFGGGLSCNGATFNFTPFYLGNDSIAKSYQRGNNWGVQAGVTVPLDGSITEMCKKMVKRKLEKERLDYELVRALKCAELIDKGYTFRPDHPLFVVCEHVVSIEAWRLTQRDSPTAPPLLLPTSSPQSSSQVLKPLSDVEPTDQQPSLPQQTPEQRLQQLLQPW